MMQIQIEQQGRKGPTLPNPVLLPGIEEPVCQAKQIVGRNVRLQHIEEPLERDLVECVLDILGQHDIAAGWPMTWGSPAGSYAG
jgi:hypothetical protein